MDIIPYGKQLIEEDDLAAVKEVLQSDYLTQGPNIKEFEEHFANYVNAKYAVAVSNGTAALHLSAIALGINESSKVITTPITFAASANCVLYCGGTVEFADVDENGLLDINSVEDLLKKHPSKTYQGIIPVDFAGYPINLAAFKTLADKYKLWILEDACHAPGAYFEKEGKKHFCGSGEDAALAIFSFHPVKHIAAGEGGMITTNDEKLYQKLCLLRTHGITKDPDMLTANHGGWYYEMHELGYNYRLSDIQAALGMSQLKKADKGLARRSAIAKKFNEAFKNTAVHSIIPTDSFHHAYHLYVIKTKDRLGLYNHLKRQNIFAQVHYIPVHLQPYSQKLGWKKGDFPQAEKYYEQCLSLPMYPGLTDDQQDFVIEQTLNFFK